MITDYVCYIDEVFQDIEDDKEEICLMIVPKDLLEAVGWKADSDMKIKLEQSDGCIVVTPFYD